MDHGVYENDHDDDDDDDNNDDDDDMTTTDDAYSVLILNHRIIAQQIHPKLLYEHFGTSESYLIKLH